MTVPMMIDTDPGVDDAVALMLAAASPEVQGSATCQWPPAPRDRWCTHRRSGPIAGTVETASAGRPSCYRNPADQSMLSARCP